MRCLLNSGDIAFSGLLLHAGRGGSKLKSGELRERTRLLVLQCLEKEQVCVLLYICPCVCLYVCVYVCVQYKALEEAERRVMGKKNE